MTSIELLVPLGLGLAESLDVEESGIVRLFGWHPEPLSDLERDLTLLLDGLSFSPVRRFRTFRPDIAQARGADAVGWGYVVEFVVPAGSYRSLALRHQGDSLAEHALGPLEVTVPAYDHLLAQSAPLRRADIYGSGPPLKRVAPEIEAACSDLVGRVLDYGCGAGALVGALRLRGVDAWGLELERAEIAAAIPNELEPYVELSDGALPSPFESGSFDAVVAVEVIEHIIDHRAALADMARLTRERLVVTTPDMSAIPLLHRHGVVPWHLLEATHVSFFTQDSLRRALGEHFARVETFRIGLQVVNGTRYFTSLLASCSEPLRERPRAHAR